ncbi:MAG: alpha/beta hydrolase [Myxococcales bacterium]|nr:alpha/beta hydrolase [Myxococcales bacterium]
MPDDRAPRRALVPRVRRADLGDVEVAYSEIGAGEDAGGGAPLVLVHGLTGHRDDFLPVMPLLALREPGLRVLAPDLRGHGDSTHAGDAAAYSFDRLVADLARFLDGLGVARCHLLGHSLGGMVTLRFALAHPRRLASLVLMSTAPFAPEGYAAATFEKGGAIAVERGMAFFQALVERIARERPSDAPSDRQARKWADAYVPHQRHRYRSMDPVAYGALGLAMVRQAPVVERLHELALPTTVLVGLDDEGFLSGADALARGIPGAVRVDLADAGHHPHREDTDGWLDAMSAHLTRARAVRSAIS